MYASTKENEGTVQTFQIQVKRFKNLYGRGFRLGFFSYCMKKKLEIAIRRTSRGKKEAKTSPIMFNNKVYSNS